MPGIIIKGHWEPHRMLRVLHRTCHNFCLYFQEKILAEYISHNGTETQRKKKAKFNYGKSLKLTIQQKHWILTAPDFQSQWTINYNVEEHFVTKKYLTGLVLKDISHLSFFSNLVGTADVQHIWNNVPSSQILNNKIFRCHSIWQFTIKKMSDVTIMFLFLS